MMQTIKTYLVSFNNTDMVKIVAKDMAEATKFLETYIQLTNRDEITINSIMEIKEKASLELYERQKEFLGL